MELLQLRYFQALAESEHLTGTARRLMISPPALSSAISRLETELGVKLFDRTARGMRLNRQGQAVLYQVREALAAIDNIPNAAHHSMPGAHAQLSIGLSSPIIWHEMFSAFVSRHPEIGLSHTVLRLEQLEDPAQLTDFDFIITTLDDLAGSEWDITVLRHNDPPCLAVYPEHPLASLHEVRLSDVREEPFIALTKGYSSRRYFDRMFALAGYSPVIVLECDYALRATMLTMQFGIVLTAGSVKETGALGNAMFIDIIEPCIQRTQALYRNKNREYSKAAGIFQNFITDFYRLRYQEA